MERFIGRRHELRRLKDLKEKIAASLVVIRGRRRIGKSRLITEFSRGEPYFVFSGIPPSKATTKQSQINLFAAEVSKHFRTPVPTCTDWAMAFAALGALCSTGRVVVAFDEISWMGSEDPDFLGHLKNAWDLVFSRNPQLILILCGSISSWIEDNILRSTGFVGRISLDLHLKELPLRDAIQFWDDYQDRVSPFDVLRVLAITGGVPRYLEELIPKRSAVDNIRLLCFEPDGLLLNEFDNIFSDVFHVRTPIYQEMLTHLATRSQLRKDLTAEIKTPVGGDISRYLHDLHHAGFVSIDPTWDLRTQKESRFKRYRLSDNYTRFYMKYIRPNKRAIEQGSYRHLSLDLLSGWDTVMGLQFENLVVNNAHLLIDALRLNPADIVQYGPYFQRKTARAAGCQIDLLLQTRHRTVYLCEIKFSAEKIGLGAGHQTQRALHSIQLPRNWTARTVLVHVNGTSRELQQSSAFDHIVDFGSLVTA